MEMTKQKIIPNLWFDREAEEAARFYTSAFGNSRLSSITRASKAGFENHGLPENSVMTVAFEIEGMRFIGINGGPLFKFNPSVSFLVSCSQKDEVDALWKILSPGGTAFMELGTYPFSPRYGWVQDRYGISWQLMFSPTGGNGQKITPTLMYVEEQWGKAEQAVNLYTSVFPGSAIDHILKYAEGDAPDTPETVKHAGFSLAGQPFAAMDSARMHEFTFSEAISFMIECTTQEEIDYYWGKLTAGGQEGVCGWLKDRFGVSWQVVPSILGSLLQDPDKEKVERVTAAFMKMIKFDIAALERAFKG